MRHFLKLTKHKISGGRMVMLDTEVSSITFARKHEGFDNLFWRYVDSFQHWLPPPQPHCPRSQFPWGSSHPSLQQNLSRPALAVVDEQLSYSDLKQDWFRFPFDSICISHILDMLFILYTYTAERRVMWRLELTKKDLLHTYPPTYLLTYLPLLKSTLKERLRH